MLDTIIQITAFLIFLAALATAPLWFQLFGTSLVLGAVGVAIETRKGNQ